MRSDEEHQKLYTDAVWQVGMEGGNAFQSWFNRSENIHQSVTRGFWDLTFHILTPQICALLKQPEEKTALEIGYGGGRILNAACNYFKSVIGVDIHSEQDLVRNFLHSLRVVASGTSYKQVPDGYPLRPGGQNFVSIVKPQ